MLQVERVIPQIKKITAHKQILICVLIILLLLLSSLGFEHEGSQMQGMGLSINEIMSSNSSSIIDEDGDCSDWIEIYNSGKTVYNLNGFGLSDDKQDPFKWKFPDITIEPGQYLLVFASGKDRRDSSGRYLHTSFKLNSKGETLLMCNSRGEIIEQFKVPEVAADVSYGKSIEGIGEWVYYDKATPGEENSITEYDKPVLMPHTEEYNVLINEFMVSNKTSIIDEDGDFSDWIEIYNYGDTPVNLERFGLSDDKNEPFKWRFPNITIESGQYLLIFASGKDRTDPSGQFLHTSFKLNSENEGIVFSSSGGQIVDEVKIPYMYSNVSKGRNPEDNGVWLYFPEATPERQNNTHGFEFLGQGAAIYTPTVMINEIMALNHTVLTDDDDEYNPWIEIYNSSDAPVNLMGWGLSDDEQDLFKWEFPDVTIGPGQYLVVFASEKDRSDPENNIFHTNFRVNPSGETVIISNTEGTIKDYLSTGNVEGDVSCGRITGGGLTRFFFEEATPGQPNEVKPYIGFASAPGFSREGGFYGVSLSLELKGAKPSDVVKYTIDGSEPTADSPSYTLPVKIERTTVVRARSYDENLLPGPIATNTYFINDKHTLTTISLSTDPANLWDEDTGIYVKGKHASEQFPHKGANYWEDMEKPVHFELYEPDGSLGLSMDCGIKIFGSYSRAMDQKSFSIYARDRYEYDRITYPFFEDKSIVEFKSILLRTSGQDATMSKIRDAMVAKVMMGTYVDVEAYHPAIVYINGEYWGVYNIREKISPYYAENNHGVDPEKVDILEANGRVNIGSADDYKELIEFVRSKDMRLAENYEYVKSRVDIDNFIDYEIAEIYCANTDTGNIKFWRDSSPGGKWRWILFDTDWGFFDVEHNTLWYVSNSVGTGIGQMFSTSLMYNLLKNEEFKQQFIHRFAYHMNNTFKSERVISIIDEMASRIEPEMPEQLERWGGSMTGWKNHIQRLRNFAEKRPVILVKYIRDQFNLGDDEMRIFNVE